MKKTFASCQQLKDIQFYNMSLTNVKDGLNRLKKFITSKEK